MQELKLFEKSLRQSEKLNFIDVNKYAVKLGYVIHPDACNQNVLDWLHTKEMNPNSTFYKSWESIISKSRFELLADQLMHYASTYGTNFQADAYIPESLNKDDIPEIKKLKVINLISEKECIEKCEIMLSSGIALKEETVNDLFELLEKLNYNFSDNIEKIKNKEFLMYVCDKLDIVPSNPQEMVRYLIYKATNKTLLIKDEDTINSIKCSNFAIEPYVTKFGLEKLSSVFYRFKPIFLAFKTANVVNARIVNKLRKKAKKYHVPCEKGFWDNILTDETLIDRLPSKVNEISNFKKISLLQTINIRLVNVGIRPFLIRNQKVWIKEESQKTNILYLHKVFLILYDSLITSLNKNACKIHLPKNIDIKLPTSEKSFIGNYPFGTTFKNLPKQNFIAGIYWREENGANDLDLSYIDTNGKKIGWNAGYHNDDIIYSGDMTTANPEATELLYMKRRIIPGIVKVNLYTGQPNSEFKILLAKEKIDEFDNFNKNYVVNPNNILFSIDGKMDSNEKTLGVITNEGEFILTQMRTGNNIVSDGKSMTNLYTDYILKTKDCGLKLIRILEDAGFDIVNNSDEADIDFNNFTKDELIKILK